MTIALPPRPLATQSPDIERAFRESAPALLGYFIRRVTPEEDAADLLSETFLAAWKSPKRNAIMPEAMKPWLFGIARNVLSQYRRGVRRRSALGDRLRSHVRADLAAQLDGSTAALNPDVAEHVRHLISDLPAIDQEIITLVYWEGFTQEEVAAILGRRAVTVRSRLSRARARLAHQLADSTASTEL
ncbi:RNA polymerase sigma factor [Microbacterium sp. A82]|uniref:RNA polymerase sigma factor n=1 Tax=unclassified Microbacterium TaxID=2609290 RepID=UPI003F38C340